MLVHLYNLSYSMLDLLKSNKTFIVKFNGILHEINWTEYICGIAVFDDEYKPSELCAIRQYQI